MFWYRNVLWFGAELWELFQTKCMHVSAHYSVGALGDSFYEYLLKGWLLHSQTDAGQREMYDTAATAIKEKLLQKKEGFTYIAEMKGNKLMHKMDHLACFVGGMFALGAYHKVHEAKGENSNYVDLNDEFMEIGKGVTATCHESYTKTSWSFHSVSFRPLQLKFRCFSNKDRPRLFSLWGQRLSHTNETEWEAVSFTSRSGGVVFCAMEDHQRSQVPRVGLGGCSGEERNTVDGESS